MLLITCELTYKQELVCQSVNIEYQHGFYFVAYSEIFNHANFVA